jgi:hypothetical protein
MVQNKHTPSERKPTKEEEGKKPELKAVSKTNSDFFEELPIYINMDKYKGETSFTVFMRPLKIKEIQILNRVTYLQEKDADSEQAAMILVNLAVRTLNVSASEMPVGTTSGLIHKLIEFNFPKNSDTSDEEDKSKSEPKNSLVDCFGFLITHGHCYNDIMEYPIPLFNDFIIVIAERLGIKKKPMDARAAFQKLGIPIKQRTEK